MAWSSQGKTAVLKLIKENFLRQFVQPTLNLIGSFEIDAIICLTVGSEQLVIKLQERLKHNHFDRIEIRNNGEPSLLREYLAGSTAVTKPKANHAHAGVTRKRKAGDENENTIFTSDKKVQHADQLTDLLMRAEPACDQEDDDNPLNLSERCRDSYQTHKGQGSLSSGSRENMSSRGGAVVGQYSCGLCPVKCNSYSSMQDHFVDIHSCNLRFICSECSAAFADDGAYSRHFARHSRQILGATNRRKQAKPRKGAAADEFSDGGGDDDIPDDSASDRNRVHSANLNGPRNFVAAAAAVAYSGDQSNGIVRSLLQKQSPLSVANLSKHSAPYGASPLDLATRDAGDGGSGGAAAAAEFQCPHCDVLLLSWNLYNDHCMQIHKRFACDVCLQTFTQRVNRDRHHYSHTDEKPFGCGQCGLGFTRRDALKKHQARTNHLASPSSRGTPQQASSINPDQSDNSADEDVDVPSVCGVLDFSEAGDCQGAGQIGEEVLSEPLPARSKDFPVSSGSKFKKRRSAVESSSLARDGELSDEMSVHSFHSADNVCLKGFSDLAGAQGADAGHRPASAGPSRDDAHRSFKCDSCQESVIGTAAYQDHCKVRHRRTPCTFCGKTFSQKGNMERHMRQHTGERPFQCQFCSSSYTRKETLKTHVNQAHSQQVNQESESNL